MPGSVSDVSELATVDAAGALVSALSRAWGEHGYRIAVSGCGWGHGVAECAASDGSRFWLAADRWGNVVGGRTTSGFDTREDAVAALMAMLEVAR